MDLLSTSTSTSSTALHQQLHRPRPHLRAGRGRPGRRGLVRVSLLPRRTGGRRLGPLGQERRQARGLLRLRVEGRLTGRRVAGLDVAADLHPVLVAGAQLRASLLKEGEKKL